METLYVVIAIFIVLQLAGWYGRFTKVAALAYRLPFLAPIKGSQLPKAYSDFHKAASEPLRKLGFNLIGVAKQRSIELQDNSFIYVTLFYNKEKNTFAWIHSAIAPIETDPVVVRFQTFFDNDAVVSTDNEYSSVSVLPNEKIVAFSITTDVAADVLAAHEDNVSRYLADHSGVDVAAVKGAQLVTRYNDAWRSDFEDAVPEGTVSGDPDTFYLGLKQSLRLLQSFHKRSRIRIKENHKRLSKPSAEKGAFRTLIPSDLVSFAQKHMAKIVMKNLMLPPTRPAVTWATFFLSAALFCVFFGIWLGWHFVPILLGVILFHELGHFLAMRVSGYTQTSIFFVPGLGAAASGRAGKASYWQRLLVIYSGPLPGIFVAAVLSYFFWGAGLDSWLTSLILVLVVLNWFNLLPFMPLDGGQAINLCLDETARYIFSWVSAVGLLLLAWGLAEPILWVVGAFALYSVVIQTPIQNLRKALSDIAGNVKTSNDFFDQGMRLMQSPKYRALDFYARVNLLHTFVEELHMPKVKPAEKKLGLFLYIFSFLLPVILFLLLTFVGGSNDTVRVKPMRDWQSEISREDSAYKSWALSVEAASANMDVYDLDEADRFIDMADTLLEEVGESEVLVADMKALKFRRFLYDENAELGAEIVAQKLSEYLSSNPSPDEEYYAILKLSLPFLRSENHKMANDVFGLSVDYLGQSSNNSELAAVFLQRSYSVSDPNIRITWATSAFGVAPESERAHYGVNLAQFCLDVGLNERAFGIYESLKGDPSTSYYYEGHAWAAMNSGKNDRAIAVYEAVWAAHQNPTSEAPLLKHLAGEDDSGELFEFDIRLNQLLIADRMQDIEKISRYVNRIKQLKAGDRRWDSDLRAVMMQSIRYEPTGWHAHKERAKLSVIERYFIAPIPIPLSSD